MPLQYGRKVIGNKCVYQIKCDGNNQMEQYHARLMVKWYTKKESIQFNEKKYQQLSDSRQLK